LYHANAVVDMILYYYCDCFCCGYTTVIITAITTVTATATAASTVFCF